MIAWAREDSETAPAWVSRLRYCAEFGVDPAQFSPKSAAVWYERWRAWELAQTLRRIKQTADRASLNAMRPQDRRLYGQLMTGKVKL